MTRVCVATIDGIKVAHIDATVIPLLAVYETEQGGVRYRAVLRRVACRDVGSVCEELVAVDVSRECLEQLSGVRIIRVEAGVLVWDALKKLGGGS